MGSSQYSVRVFRIQIQNLFVDVAVGEKTLGASVTSSNPKKRAKAKTIMVLNMSLAFVISILNFLIAGFE
jgi:hypothetical protein